MLEALKEFEVQFEDDSEDENNREMFGTIMRCPENDLEAFEMARKMEEDASRWGQCDDDSEELECSDEEQVFDNRSNNEPKPEERNQIYRLNSTPLKEHNEQGNNNRTD